jgi:hypothetical protein
MDPRSGIFALRKLRWFVCGVSAFALWACNARRLAAPSGDPSQVVHKNFVQSLNRKIDLLFMVDDSASMERSQAKLVQRLPDFMDALGMLQGGLPDMHVAVVSSSLGAGAFPTISHCSPGSPGDDDGRFQHPANCTGLNPNQTFIKAGGGDDNFTGAIGELFGCMALLGANGCGFEHQFKSVRRALEKAGDPNDPDNGGFLRADAYLAIVMLTNEDDCSAPYDSDLFNPNQTLLSDPLGGLQSYRCNEFGHLCNGVRPPHDVSGPTPLENCVSAEDGRLDTVADFVKFLKGLKVDQKKVLVAALAGKPTPYVVEPKTFEMETQPSVQHSCTGTIGGSAGSAGAMVDYADPAVRIFSWVQAFGENGVFESICDNDFKMSMKAITDAISRALTPACIGGNVLLRADGRPSCEVVETKIAAQGQGGGGTAIQMCDGTRSLLPCWELLPDTRCGDGKMLQMCRDATCDQKIGPTEPSSVDIYCEVGL